MSERNKAEQEETVFQKLEKMQNEVAYHLFDIETMIKIGEEAALAEGEQENFKIDWDSMFSIMGKLHKAVHDKLQELEMLIIQERIREQNK